MNRRRTFLHAILASIAIGGVCVVGSFGRSAKPGKILWSDSFDTDQWPAEWHVTHDDWGTRLRERFFQKPNTRKSRLQKPEDLPDSFPPNSESFLRVRFPLGSSSPASHRTYGTPLGGSEWYAKPLAPVDHLFLRYYVRFAPDFKFNKGGKLPGLFGGTCCSGGCVPDGTNGFSTRYMWRTNGDGEVYAYLDMTSKTGYGISLGRGSWTFQPGRWYCIEQGCRLNDPKKSNGVIVVWIDGKEVLRESALKFRTVTTLQIEGILFSTFYGGDDASWGAPTDSTIDFGDFAISEEYIGV